MEIALVNYTPEPVKTCGLAAAVCTRSGNPETALRHAVESGHTSVLEHAVFTFKIEGISRVTLAQLTRHRLASFDVESQRYVDMDNYDFVVPQTIQQSPFLEEYCNLLCRAHGAYKEMVAHGIPKEDARYIIPQAVKTQLYMTMNARELLHFFSLRTCNRAQWEIREMADAMLEQCIKVAPEIFQGAGPGCVTSKCKETRPCGHPRCAS